MNDKSVLLQQLKRLSAMQFKMFYAALVHYWVKYKFFISKQNFFNLWCELNSLCHELDESFPSLYDDYEVVKDFCQCHPYYFIDRLPLELVAKLFDEHIDDRIDVLVTFIKQLCDADLHTAYAYVNEALSLSDPVDELVSDTKTHIEISCQ